MKKSALHLITEIPRRRTKVETTIGVDLGVSVRCVPFL